MTLRERLKKMKRREAAGLLQRSAPFITQLVNGQRSPSVALVAHASAVLGLDDAEIGASVRDFAGSAARDEVADHVATAEPEHATTSDGEAA